MSVGSFGSGCPLRGRLAAVSVVVVGAAATRNLLSGGERSSNSRRWPGFGGLLLPAPLLLPQQLLSLQQDPGVDAGRPHVAVPRAGTAGVSRRGVFSGLESLRCCIHAVVPGALGRSGLARLPDHREKSKNQKPGS